MGANDTTRRETTMTITSKFNGHCTACGGTILAGTRVNWIKDVKGVTHADAAACRQVREARAAYVPPLTGVTADASKIVAFLTAARERGLQFPKVRFLSNDNREITMSLAGRGSKYPGAVQVKLAGEWVGRVEANGNVAGSLARNTELLATVNAIAEDPATAARAYGKLSGACSFCGKRLTDDRSGSSVEVGYGPSCAKRFGLPHRPTGKARVLAAVPVMADEPADMDDYAREGGGPEFAEPVDDNPIDETAYDAPVDDNAAIRETLRAMLADWNRLSADQIAAALRDAAARASEVGF